MKHKFLTTILSATGRLCLPVLFCVPVFLNGCGNSGADSDDVMNVSIFCDGEMPSPDNKIFNMNKLFGKHVRECALVLMERDGYHNRRPIEYIKLYIESHYKDDISLGWFSEKLYVNAAYLGQKFKKETGVSVNRFLHRFRIEEAKRLARTTDMNWSEIAAEVGYKNYLSFFEHFQKIEQISPSDFKG